MIQRICEVLSSQYLRSQTAAKPTKAIEVYSVDTEEFDKVMGKLFKEAADERGITEEQFVEGLKKLPDLEAALMKDMDPDWGRLRSYRTPSQDIMEAWGLSIEILCANVKFICLWFMSEYIAV